MKLRVLSYNIHKCIGGLDRRYDPSRIVEVIQRHDADVVMLQEVDAGATRSNRDHQVELLGERLGMSHHAWFPNVDVRGGGQYGNAILSRHPLIESTNIDLSLRWKKKRSVLHGVLRVRHDRVDRTIHVFNMHLGLARFERRLQLQKFLDSHPFAGLHGDTPIVVGGDLNDVYGRLGGLLTPSGFRGPGADPSRRTAAATGDGTTAETAATATPLDGQAPGNGSGSGNGNGNGNGNGGLRRPMTFPAWGPIRPLDAIFVRGELDLLELNRCDSELARRASDHRPLVAELALRPVEAAHHGDHEHAPPAPRP